MKKYISPLVLYYLRFFSRIALGKQNLQIIGIAGSVGKSSLRNIIYAILKDRKETLALWGNSETGIPLSILGLTPSNYSIMDWVSILVKAPFRTNNLKPYGCIVTEMGIDDPRPPKNMDYLLTIIKPDIAINLNVSATHTEQFENFIGSSSLNNLLDAIAHEDTKIITESGCAVGIYNADNPFILKHVKKGTLKNGQISLLSIGASSKNSIYQTSYDVSLEKTRFSFALNEKKPYELTISLRGMSLPRVYGETFGAAILAARSLKIPLKDIQEGIEENFSLPKGRAEILAGIRNTTIIDSTYNASKESNLAFLQLLEDLKKKTGKRAAFVFGDMRELGSISESEHNEVAIRASGIADFIYCVGPQTLEYVIPALKNLPKIKEIDWFKNSVQLGLHLKETLPEDSVILFKGSQNEIFLEEAVKFILKNPQDEKKLCRQSKYWHEVKASFINPSQA